MLRASPAVRLLRCRQCAGRYRGDTNLWQLPPSSRLVSNRFASGLGYRWMFPAYLSNLFTQRRREKTFERLLLLLRRTQIQRASSQPATFASYCPGSSRERAHAASEIFACYLCPSSGVASSLKVHPVPIPPAPPALATGLWEITVYLSSLCPTDASLFLLWTAGPKIRLHKMAPRNLGPRCLTPLFLLQFFFCTPQP